MADVTMFINRLRKNARHWDKWARRRDIECYRLYDRDIPEYPVIVDRYGEYVHLQEYEAAWEASEADYAAWVEDVYSAVTEVLQLSRYYIAFKQRRRQKGLAQYEKTGASGRDLIVTEGGHRFIVNLGTYLDTGLFLDHRHTRGMIEERAQGKRFLNLFAYTGSFTVYAAAGGAVSSVTVDMSNTYQDWARRNFELNGLDLKRHQLVRADVFKFLEQAITRPDRFDLIVLDPPSFSNSKKMEGVLDIQRDHVRLIEPCMQLLSPWGELFFSTNLRSFKLDEPALGPSAIREITRQTIPEDFRDTKIHRCWIVTHA
jgi:23S rRNA (cytosine1962-C5)-methyltransferase